MDVSIVIPAYNEEQRIGGVLVRLEDIFREDPALSTLKYEVIVVADGCSDNTVETINRFSADNQAFRAIDYQPNRGKGYAIRTGMAATKGEVVFFMDADGSTALEPMPHFIDLVKTDADVAIGSRRISGANITTKQPFHRQIVGKACSLATKTLLQLPYEDTQCGFKAFKGDVGRKLFDMAETDGFAIDIEILALAKSLDYKIVEVGITWQDDERSSVSAVGDGLDMFKKILQFRSITKKQR